MNDLVDDLHAAEDMASVLAAALRYVNDNVRDDTPEMWSRVEVALAGWAEYCRPSCGANGDPLSDECDDDTCGCPCGHTDKRQESEER
jgi:hypothetical protein